MILHDSKTNKIVITKDTNILELTTNYPDAAEVLTAFGLHCVGCFASQFDTIGQGAEIHGMYDDEVDELIDEINKVVNGEVDVDDYRI